MIKTVESCLAGQPDKVCDQVADAIVDAYVRQDPKARVDVSVMGSHGMMMIGGEVTSTADLDLGALACKVYADIGYPDDVEVFVNIEGQSDEMRDANGPSDTVIVNGYATRETREMLPRPVVFAHHMARRIDDLRVTNPEFSWLKPDGKVQLMMDGSRVKAVTLLASHQVSIDPKEVRSALLERVVMPIVGDEGAQIFINPIGPFTVGGFRADSGANGRRRDVDAYGGLIPFGSVGLSGKDPLKAERAGACMARYVARWIVGQELASSAMVQLVYTMGRDEPIHVRVVGTGEKSRGAKMDLTAAARQEFDFRPEAIVERLGLARPLYQSTATYGHFGRSGFPWEGE